MLRMVMMVMLPKCDDDDHADVVNISIIIIISILNSSIINIINSSIQHAPPLG